VDDRSDPELARRIASGGPGRGPAEAELCARFARRARLYGLRHLRDEQAAADLAQRAMLVTIERLRQGEVVAPERIGSFVLGVCRLLAGEARRRARREAPVPGDHDEVAAPADPEPLPLAALARCLEGLSERERAVVLLTFYDERAPAEIAAAVSASEGNVRVIRHRAIARLRGCMGLEEGTP
jgi:RNA polymerase sigma-70 factor (ECF subfamily)